MSSDGHRPVQQHDQGRRFLREVAVDTKEDVQSPVDLIRRLRAVRLEPLAAVSTLEHLHDRLSPTGVGDHNAGPVLASVFKLHPRRLIVLYKDFDHLLPVVRLPGQLRMPSSDGGRKLIGTSHRPLHCPVDGVPTASLTCLRRGNSLGTRAAMLRGDPIKV